MAVASGLSTVTVNSSVKDLIENEAFIEGEPIQQKMGRPALNYHFNYDFEHYLLISIQEIQTELYAMVKITNMLGEIKQEKTYLRYRKIRPDLAKVSKFKLPFYPFSNYLILAFLAFVLVVLGLAEDTRIALFVTPVWFIFLIGMYKIQVHRLQKG